MITEHSHSPLLRCQLVDFRSDQKGLALPLFAPLALDLRIGTAADKVARWIANHFSPSHEGAQTVNDVLNGAVTVTELMPVILQHVGHSRTVVGYEVQKNGECNLLVFDPSRCVQFIIPLAQSLTANCQNPTFVVACYGAWITGRCRNEFARAKR